VTAAFLATHVEISGAKTTLIAAALAVALALVASAQQSRPAGQTETLQSEVLISTLPAADLSKQIAAATGTIEHKSEVARGGPVAAVVRTTGCMKDTAGAHLNGCYKVVVTIRDLRRVALPPWSSSSE
jgi:hypothetical protein